MILFVLYGALLTIVNIVLWVFYKKEKAALVATAPKKEHDPRLVKMAEEEHEKKHAETLKKFPNSRGYAPHQKAKSIEQIIEKLKHEKK
jgi:hypothetical protein